MLQDLAADCNEAMFYRSSETDLRDLLIYLESALCDKDEEMCIYEKCRSIYMYHQLLFGCVCVGGGGA